MTAPIVVGVDPRRHDPEAPVLAALLARAMKAPVLAVAAYDDDGLGGGARDHEHRGAALARLSAVEAAFYGIALETCAVAGPSAARVLRGCAEESGAGLLVVGSSRRGIKGRIALGHTADRVLHGAPCPIAVAPLGFANRMCGIDRIGAAFVDDDEGYDALRAAAVLATACEAELHAATAVEPLPFSATLAVLRERAEARLHDALHVVAPDVPSRAEAFINGVVPALEQLSHDVDLLVCGSRGYGPLGSVLLGSVSRRLIHRAACPVIVVPPGTERALEALAGTPEALEANHA